MGQRLREQSLFSLKTRKNQILICILLFNGEDREEMDFDFLYFAIFTMFLVLTLMLVAI